MHPEGDHENNQTLDVRRGLTRRLPVGHKPMQRDQLRFTPSALAMRLHDELADGSKLLGQLASRWRFIFMTLLVCLIASLCIVLNIPAQFMAEAVLIVDPRRNSVAEAPASLTGLPWDDGVAVNTEVSMLMLPQLIANVVHRLNLTGRPGYQRSSAGVATTFLNLFRQPLPPIPAARQDEAFAIGVATRHMRIVSEPRAYAIRVRYTWPDPIHAAEVANAIADAHIATQRAARMQSIREASDWLHREIATLQERVVKAETAELAYRKEHGLGDERATSTAQQEVNALALQVTLATSERAQAEARLQQATAGVMTTLEEAANVATDRENNLRQQLKEAQARLDQVLAAEAGLRAVTRESAASRVLLEDLLRRARSAESQLEAPRPETRIGSRAQIPIQPSGLPLSYLVPGIVLGSLVLALGFGFLLAKLQVGFRSAEEMECALGLETLGEVPKFRGGARRVLKTIVRDPTSPLAEAVRTICARLNDPGVILVTSAAPGDGKTLLASALAQTFALSNRSCLFVDADFRRPSAHRVFNVESTAGLGEVLAGTTPLEKALINVLPGPLSFLPAGDVVRDPLELLSPDRLLPFLDSVRRMFDIVVMDSPPVLPVADASLIAGHVNHVLFAIRWSVTTRSAADRAITILKRQGGSLLVLALTQVDPRKISKYEGGRYGMDLSYRGRTWARQRMGT
jgi:polysaccharide biosynthesis transport protein